MPVGLEDGTSYEDGVNHLLDIPIKPKTASTMPPRASTLPADELKSTEGSLGTPEINTDYDVKSGAVASKDKNIVYISPLIPKKFHDSIAVHEVTEKNAMANGETYSKAHIQATLAERDYVLSKGEDWDTYVKAVDPFVAKAENKKTDNPPPDPHVPIAQAVGKHSSEHKTSALVKADEHIGDTMSDVDERPIAGQKYAGDVIPFKQRLSGNVPEGPGRPNEGSVATQPTSLFDKRVSKMSVEQIEAKLQEMRKSSDRSPEKIREFYSLAAERNKRIGADPVTGQINPTKYEEKVLEQLFNKSVESVPRYYKTPEGTIKTDLPEEPGRIGQRSNYRLMQEIARRKDLKTRFPNIEVPEIDTMDVLPFKPKE